MVAGIAERRRAAELEGQAERIGDAAKGIIDGARQLEQTAAAVARLNGLITNDKFCFIRKSHLKLGPSRVPLNHRTQHRLNDAARATHSRSSSNETGMEL